MKTAYAIKSEIQTVAKGNLVSYENEGLTVSFTRDTLDQVKEVNEAIKALGYKTKVTGRTFKTINIPLVVAETHHTFFGTYKQA